MFNSVDTPAKKYSKGMGKAVADRTINRRFLRKFKKAATIKLTNFNLGEKHEDFVNTWIKENEYEVVKWSVIGNTIKVIVSGKYEVEDWEDVAHRVAVGNALLAPVEDQQGEFSTLNHHLRQASILMSGRHLQHGDETQPTRNQEVFTNCSTAAASFLTFYLLLNGSGVGRCYDDDMMVVDWSNLPTIVTVVDGRHADVASGLINTIDRRTAEHLYAHKTIHVFEVPDSREGWAQAIEKMETMAFEKKYKDHVLLIDFSLVRPKGSPIGGMQNRPASGPGPLIDSINKVVKVRDSGMSPWRQAMYVDHYLAECVLVGGARRAARMSTKHWTDDSILEFIDVKRGGFLWSSNNSVTVDKEFWDAVKKVEHWKTNVPTFTSKTAAIPLSAITVKEGMASIILERLASAAYNDGTGEPGIINQDRLSHNNEGLEKYVSTGSFIGSTKYKLSSEALVLGRVLGKQLLQKQYTQITNPCGEITLNSLGGYCVIADVVPYHAQSDEDAEEAFRVATRALIRTNLMDCLYRPEVDRTNRIGVGMTGIHEYAWKRFGYAWKEVVDENKSRDFWEMLARFKAAVDNEADTYAKLLGVVTPHTNTTIKPAGTTSKLFGLTEGAHLPSMREYLRWVQLRNDDPLVEQYKILGYPVKQLKIYSGTTIVGFPTRPEICRLGMGDRLVTAAEATPSEQYEYLRLLEKYWIVGLDNGNNEGGHDTGNQVSYTLKYNPKVVSYEDFKRTLIEGQSTIRCCSVMPQTDTEVYAYEYLPEHPVTKHDYEQIVSAIMDDEIKEDVAVEHVDCSSGACPIDFGKNSASEVRA